MLTKTWFKSTTATPVPTSLHSLLPIAWVYMTTTERTKILSVTMLLTIHVYMQKLCSGYYRSPSLRTNQGHAPRINPPTPTPTPHPLHPLTLLGANSRDTNLWRSKIWRLSLFHYPPPPPPPPPEIQWTPPPTNMGMTKDIIWSLTWSTYYQNLRSLFWWQK